ncbi:hypothetical protein [Succinimonas sp.]|uniref:hypothetical protein n=1 Tax=Succinimonas sp. TaxID=1936151 RepID=UPI003866A8D2
MKKSTFVTAIMFSLLISGCAGTHLSTEEVHQFNINTDTEATVKSRIGEPWQTFNAVNEEEMKAVLTKLPEIRTADYIHRLGVYTFSFSPLLSHDNAYFELNIFIYSPDGVLRDVAEYTCYTQQSCEDMLEAEKQKYALEDWQKLSDDVKVLLKDKKEKQLIAEKQKKAEEERQRRLALAQAAKVQKKSAASGKVRAVPANNGGSTAGTSTVKEVTPAAAPSAPATPASSGSVPAEQPKTTVRKNIGI